MEKSIIDIEARFTDGISGAAGAAISAVERLARTKVFVKFNADNSSFLKAISKAKSYADKLGKTKISATLNATDKATRVMGKVWNFGLKIGSAVWRGTVSVVDKATAPLRGIFRLLRNPVLRTGMALGLSFGLKNMLDTYTGFESMMDKVGAISGATAGQMDMLTAKAKEMGAATEFTATQSGEAMSYMAMAGWTPDQMMNGIGGIMNLASASGESLGTTADIVTDALTAFKMTANESTHFADVLAAASSKSNTNVALMGETFKYAATQAGTLGYTAEDVALSAGLMANAGIKGSMAGSALANIWTRLATNTGGAADALKAVGVQFYDQYGNARRWRDVLDELRVATADMTDEQKSNLAYTVAGIRGQKGLLPMLEASADDYKKLATAVDKADGASARMARRMMDNLGGSIKLLQSAAEGAKLTIMEKAGPAFRSFVDWLAEKMPGIGDSVGSTFQNIGDGIQNIRRKISGVTHNPGFAKANLGQKISMLWNGVVADPLSEWWNGGGREKAIETAGSIGKDLGEILKTGLLTIFGMTGALTGESSAAMSAGASIAKSFAEGFAEGFDANLVGEKLKEALGNVVDGLGNLWDKLPGWGRALAGGIIGSKLVGGISSAVLGGIGLYKGAKQGVGMLSQVGLLLTGRSAASAAMAGSTAAAVGGTTAAAGGTAASSSMAAATGAMAARTAASGSAVLGAGAVLGGVTGGITVVNGIGDWIRGGASKDKAEKQAYYDSGSSKILGTAGGAVLGAAIGSVIPGLGTAIGAFIGAGIGGKAGSFAGNKLVKDMKAAKFESEEMKAAIDDTNISAEELGQTFDSVVYRKMKKSFGDMELSAKEISRLAEQITWGGNLESANRFIQASQATQNSLTAMQTAASSTDRWMWKAGLGVTFDENETADIANAFEDYTNSAQSYLENKHYEFTASAGLFMNIKEGEGKSFVDSSSAYFTKIEDQVEALSEQLGTQLDISLKDGKITLDEQSIITDLQKQIADIIEKVENAESAADESLLDLKYGGRKLSLESFIDLNSELQNSNKNGFETLDEGYRTVYKGLYTEYNDPGTTADRKTELDSELNRFNQDYIQTAKEMKKRSESRLKDTLTNTYGGGVANALWGGIQKSLKEGISPMEWETGDVEKLLGTANLSNETTDEYKRAMEQAFNTLSPLETGEKSANATLKANFDVETENDPAEEIQKILSAGELSDLTAEADVKIDTSWEVQKVESPEGEILALVSPDKQYSVPLPVLAELNWTIDRNTGKPDIAELVSPDGETRIPINAQLVPNWTGGTFDVASAAQEAVNATGTPSLEMSANANLHIDEVNTDTSGITAGVQENIPPIDAAISVNTTYNVNKFTGQQVSDFGVQPQYDFTTVVVIAPSYIVSPKFTGSKDVFGIQSSYSASTTVTIDVSYSVNKGAMPNLTAGIPKKRGGLIGPNGPMGFASGGMVRGGPQLVTVAEEGTPEMIIPLGSQRRQRGLELWRKAGYMLGVKGYAQGGITGMHTIDHTALSSIWQNTKPFASIETQTLRTPGRTAFPQIPAARMPEPTEFPQIPVESAGKDGETKIIINVGGITIHIDGNGADGNIVENVEQHGDEIADMIVGAVNRALVEVFENTPVKGGETV